MTQSTSSSFDPYAWRNFFFEIDREEATRLLCEHPDSTLGTFLIRDSTSPGSYALSVREDLSGDQQVRHYLIEPVCEDDGSNAVKIAEQRFVDIPALLNHFKMRILANVSLIKPLQKPAIQKMIALYSFQGEQATDLSFEKNELLEIIGKPQDGWWQARNALGATGLVPANYLTHPNDVVVDRSSSPETSSLSSENRLSNISATSEGNDCIPYSSNRPGQAPSWARVVLDRRPNVYDTEALRLKKGELIKVTKVHPSGICEGILNGKKGTFPFTYVEFLSDNDANTPIAF